MGGQSRRLRSLVQRRLGSGNLLITYAINVPGDATALVTTTGAEVGNALLESTESEIGSAISTSVDNVLGTGAFTIAVTSASPPDVVVRQMPSVTTTSERMESSTSTLTSTTSTVTTTHIVTSTA